MCSGPGSPLQLVATWSVVGEVLAPGPVAGVGPAVPGASTSPPTDQVATSCNGDPGPEHILVLLRDEGLLADDTEATVAEGPLCADGWQYTVVVVPDRDPLQVVTSGQTGDLALVTAGTDVCTVEVRVRAPIGIRTVASCVG